jgi:hypothetical protein
VKALRGPSYLRIAGSSRTGVVEVPAAAPRAAGTAERKPSRHDESLRRILSRWRAPVLSDEAIETYGKVFLMKPGHELVPFFLWIEDAIRR